MPAVQGGRLWASGVYAFGRFARAVKSLPKRLVEGLSPRIARVYRRRRDLLQTTGLPPTPTLFDLTLRGDSEAIADRENAADVSAMLSLIDACDIFVDVGAYIGFYSCIAARKGKYAIAVEPQPMSLQVLQRNLVENGLAPRFEIHAAALGDREGSAAFFGGREYGSLLPDWAGIRAESQYTSLVSVNTLDRLVDGRFPGEHLLINIDVEGNEHALMLGASKTMRRDPKPVWVLEICLTENFPGSLNPHFLEVFEIFWREGYVATPLTEPAHILSHDEVLSWIDQRRTNHTDVHYLFRNR